MKRLLSGVAVGAFSVLLAAGSVPTAFAGGSGLNGTAGENAMVTSTPKATNGSVKCTAAINSNGSVLSCKHCNVSDTSHLGTGAYQVGFSKPCQNILAVNGWSRWVQVDTLSTGEEFASCTTADRAGDANAVFVACVDSTGASVDASFFLFVAK